MPRVYVSYRSTEQVFVTDVVNRLKLFGHEIHIDYDLPLGADWRSEQLQQLRECDVFLLFVSRGTRESDFQNAEMGSARIWSTLVDRKQILPIRIDDVEPPRPLAHLDCPRLPRDAEAVAHQVQRAIEERQQRVRLFISHAHRDQELALALVSTLKANLLVPAGELRCTSVPGYQLELGAHAGEALKRELGSAACVLALLTPTSLENDWVLFELGAAWLNARATIPLLAGGLEDKDLPGPLRGAAGGQLSDPGTLQRLVSQLERELRWARSATSLVGSEQLISQVKSWRPSVDPVIKELKAQFTTKRARIRPPQNRLLDLVTLMTRGKRQVDFETLASESEHRGNELFYRLEQLRLLGFITRIDLGEREGKPAFAWRLSDRYRNEIDQ